MAMLKSTKAVEAVLAALPDRGETYALAVSRVTGYQSGAVVPVLHRLEAAGLVVSRREDGDPKVLGRPCRRYYQLTEAGRRDRAALERLPVAVLEAELAAALGRIAELESALGRIAEREAVLRERQGRTGIIALEPKGGKRHRGESGERCTHPGVRVTGGWCTEDQRQVEPGGRFA